MNISHAADGPGEEDLAAEQERLPDDQQQHAEVHRAAHEPVRAALDEPLRRSPRRRRAASVESEARGRLEHERSSGDQQDDPEDAERGRLLVRVPASQEPRHDARDDRRPADHDEARAADERSSGGAR